MPKSNSIVFHLVPDEILSSQMGEESREITQQLRGELLELDYVDSVEYLPADQNIPKGSKGIPESSIGSLLVTLATSSGVLESITATVQSCYKIEGNKKG